MCFRQEKSNVHELSEILFLFPNRLERKSEANRVCFVKSLIYRREIGNNKLISTEEFPNILLIKLVMLSLV